LLVSTTEFDTFHIPLKLSPMASPHLLFLLFVCFYPMGRINDFVVPSSLLNLYGPWWWSRSRNSIRLPHLSRVVNAYRRCFFLSFVSFTRYPPSPSAHKSPFELSPRRAKYSRMHFASPSFWRKATRPFVRLSFSSFAEPMESLPPICSSLVFFWT